VDSDVLYDSKVAQFFEVFLQILYSLTYQYFTSLARPDIIAAGNLDLM
jgi:hypothetical protein